jgi:hypothetical protein
VPNDVDMRDGLDALQGDMATHQRLFKGEVTAETNRQLAASEFEKLDRMASEEPAPATATVVPTPQAFNETREVDGRRYNFSRSTTDDVAFRSGSADEQKTVIRCQARIELLLTKSELGSKGDGFMPEFIKGELRFSKTPACWLSWRDRVLAVMSWKIAAQQPGNAPWRAELEKMHALLLIQLMDDSVAHFGDWKSDPEPTISAGA